MKIIENPDWIKLEPDAKNAVPYIVGRCNKCREHFILKFSGAHKYKCPYCKREFIIRRNR